MAAITRILGDAARRTDRQLRAVGDEFREQRLQLGVSQVHVARSCGISRNYYGLIENGRATSLTIRDLNRIASVLGLTSSTRVYPAGLALRDVGQTSRLTTFLQLARPPLTFGVEVPLPRRADHVELRAWDAMLFGHDGRTAIELEMRLRDVQAMRRRIDLKRRDDPTEHFLLLVADTRSNRRIVSEFGAMFADLPRLRPTGVAVALAGGEHPGTGLLLV